MINSLAKLKVKLKKSIIFQSDKSSIKELNKG